MVRVLRKTGYVLDRQKASLIILRETREPFRRITVPDHGIRSGTVSGIKGSFLFASLRSHPRFQALLAKMNLAVD